MTQRIKISAFVICFNEERLIERCLKSLAWCDELIIVDSGSTDKTLDICKKYSDKIFQHSWQGYIEQKVYAASLCSHEWIVCLDADEELSLDLIAEIKDLLSDPQKLNQYQGYELSRVVYYWGKWWRKGGWYPEFRLRFFKYAQAKWSGSNPHEKIVVLGKTRRLKNELYHYTYQDLDHQIRSLNSHSTVAAQVLAQNGKRAGLADIFFRPIVRFIKFYFLKAGFKEGFPGLIVAILEAWSVFVKYVKLLQYNQKNN